MNNPIVPYWVLAVGLLIVVSGIADYLRRQSRPSRVASKIYGLIVTASRQPELYGRARIPDTMEGRFEAIALHTVLILDRLLSEAKEGAVLARALVEVVIADLDDQFREMGVSDLAVPKRVKKAAGALHDRLVAYRPGLTKPDTALLTEAFRTSGLLPESHSAETDNEDWPSLAAHAISVRHALVEQSSRRVLDGQINFPEYAPKTAVRAAGSGAFS